MQAERTFISINYVASRMVSQCHHNYLLHFLSVSLPNFFNLFIRPDLSFIQNIAESVENFAIFVLIENKI
jgi:hypothetical protein